MPDAPPRLTEIRGEGEAAIAAAGTVAELQELRVRYLGRKAELTQMLRSIGDLPPEQRGPVGKGANEVQATLEDLLGRRRSALEAAELERAWAPTPIDVTLPGDPPAAPGHLHLITADPPRDRGRVPGPRLLRRRGAGGRVRLLQLHRAQPSAGPSGADAPGHLLLRPTRCCCARTHRRCRCGRWRSRSRRSTSSCRARSTGATPTRRTRRCSTRSRAWPSTRTSRSRTSRDAAGVRPRVLRRRARGPPAPALLPLHRAQRGGRRLVLRAAAARARWSTASGEPLQGLGLDRDPGRGHGRSQRARASWPTTATTPSRCRASRSAWGSSGSPCSGTACPTCASSSTTTCASWSSSGMRVPLAWLRALLRPGPRRPRRSPSALDLTGTEVERIEHVGLRPSPDELRGRQGPAAPSSTPTPTA